MKAEDLFSCGDRIILDVRSPSEFAKGHIPGAISFPLFSDEGRKEVGIIYKQEGKEKAIIKGLTLIDVPGMLEEIKKIAPAYPLVVYCARGGMRSQSVGWLLKQVGYPVETLNGGYKFFRRWVQKVFEKQYPLIVLGGKTGVGKTEVLHELTLLGEDVVDLEGMASHKGSVFGGDKETQPTQQQFENRLAKGLFLTKKTVWIEDESQMIGGIKIPQEIFSQMRKAICYLLEMPFERRMKQTIENYIPLGEETLTRKIFYIKKHLGAERTKNALSALREKDYETCCDILLNYYDKKYIYGASRREKEKVFSFDMGDKSFSAVARELREAFEATQIKEGDSGRLS